jgi:hypothetical protein
MHSAQPFVFAAFGSSVSAGHDNHPNVSWPLQLEGLLKPAFEKLGFGFEMRQRSLGGYGGAPFSSGCLHNRAGQGVDVISWDWHMFRDVKCIMHQYVQEAYTLNGANQHAPVIFDMEQTGPSPPWRNLSVLALSSNKTIMNVRAHLFKNDDLDGNNGHLDKRTWHPATWYLTEEFIAKDELDRWSQVNSGKLRLQEFEPTSSVLEGGEEWDMESLFEKPNEEQQAELDRIEKETFTGKWSRTTFDEQKALDGFSEAGFGYEAFYSSAGLPHVSPEYWDWYAAREKAFMINWHPGPLGHLLIAAQVAHYLLSETLLALEDKEGTAPVPKMPAAPSPECGLSKFCATGVMPHDGADINSIVLAQGNWRQDYSINMGGHIELSYDKKKPFIGRVGDGELVLKVEAHRPGDVALLCMAPCGWRCASHQGFLMASTNSHEANGVKHSGPKADVEYKLDGRLVSDQELLTMTESLFNKTGSFCPGCNEVARVCQGVAELQGQHQISLQVRPRNWDRDPHTFVELLQVMVVPGPNSQKTR